LVWSTVAVRHWSPESIISPGTPVAAYDQIYAASANQIKTADRESNS